MNKWKQFRFTKDPDRIISKIKGLDYKLYREKWQKAQSLKLVQNYPIHLDFEMHYGCNLKCPQCILQADRRELDVRHPYHVSKKANKISFLKFKEIIDEGVTYGLCSVTLGVNNEPLLDKSIINFINYAFNKGILDIILITNATLLTEEMSQKLIDSGLTKLYFSIDAATEETYRKIRKGGKFKDVIKNIMYLLELKRKNNRILPITRVSFVKSKANKQEENDFIRFWKRKVDYISIQAFYAPSYGTSQARKLGEEYQISNNSLKKSGSCSQPFQRLTIYYDGSVHPCCNWPGATLDVGNIYNDSIYNIWNSDKMKELRKSINNRISMPRECKICRQAVFGKY
jgi:radical SAM protein with 4Fe4S-binding SPASM domain